MQVSVESLSNLERKMTVQVPVERVQTEVDKRLRSLVRRVRVDGFRPGKVPLKVVQQRYGDSVYQEVLGEIIQTTYQDALTQEQITPAGLPRIEAGSMQPGQPFEYVAVFEVFPELNLVSMAEVQIRRPLAEVTEADLDRVIDSLRKQRRDWVDVERAAADGDQVVIDFVGSIDGEIFDGGSAEDATIELGQGRMIKGFEEQLAGMAVGDHRNIQVQFPDDYPAAHLAGKQAEFAVTMKKVCEPVLPELDEEFARAFGVAEGGIEKLRQEVRENMERELAQAVKARIKEQVMDALLANHPVDVPRSIVKEEINRLREQLEARFGGAGKGRSGLPDEQFQAEAERRVALGLLVREIISRERITVDADLLEKELAQMAASYEHPEQVMDYYRGNRQAMAGLESVVIEQQVVDWVLSQCQVSDEATSFESVMNPSRENKT